MTKPKSDGETMSDIVETMRIDQALDAKSDDEIADLLRDHVLPDYDVMDPRAMLVMHVVMRLRESE